MSVRKPFDGTRCHHFQHVSRRGCISIGAKLRVVSRLPCCHVRVNHIAATVMIAEMLNRNSSLSCDSDLFRMTGQVDQYYWSLDNVTALCVRQCLDDSSNWVVKVESACEGQTFNVAGKLVPVDSVAGRYNEGVAMACSTPK
jgi:hypothetical protein